MEIGKAVLGYGATMTFTWLAARYHLTDAQITAIMMDAGALAAAAAGIYAHTAAKKGDNST